MARPATVFVDSITVGKRHRKDMGDLQPLVDGICHGGLLHLGWEDLPRLGINAGAAFGETKVYPAARIAAAVALVQREQPVLPVVFCGPGEGPLAADIASRLEGAVLSCHLAPPDLGELKALLGRMDVLATTDAGPRHVAEALGTPTVVWMGPTDPRWSGHSRAAIVRHEALECLGCHEKTCPIGLPCMRELAPERVAEAILCALQGRGGGGQASEG